MAVLSRPEPLSDDILIWAAQPGDEDTVLDLLAEAAAWLQGRGIAQWPARFPTSSVRGQIAAGEALLVGQPSHPVATVAVADHGAELWGADTEPAYYTSRLAVARRVSDAHLGYRIIDWVALKAAEHGRRYVRLATASNNPVLRHCYERAGFQHVADPPQARWPTSLYQRQVGANGRS
ncbi:hypothetical protein [Streptomyces sp. NPDC101234]|uniref:hypothetical protein n=1 Tax=Streptomyces sp. NPDC101234 TaxID=3366138 RepID=UPI00382DC131